MCYNVHECVEHVLRLALINKNQCGYDRNKTIHEINKYQSLSKVIDVAKDKYIFKGCNESRWYAVAKIIRNKSVHYLLPLVLTKYAENPELKNILMIMICQNTMINIHMRRI